MLQEDQGADQRFFPKEGEEEADRQVDHYAQHQEEEGEAAGLYQEEEA